MRFLLCTLILSSLSALGQLQIDLQTFATGFTRPVDIQNDGDSRLYIVEQPGQIWILDSLGNKNSSPFLDIRSRVNDSNNEQGLLGMAFYPNSAGFGNFFVHYTDSNGNSQISLFARSLSDPDSADPASEFKIINIPQPFPNHNGGSIEFGPDGYLYITMGDGGSAGDPNDVAQNLTSYLGKILRIDINTAMPYGIPPSNPFAGAGGGIKEEIWAYGLRNPWKISFDRLNGNLWIGDVGQDAAEEIDFQNANSAGGENYGWRCKEGTLPFNTSNCPPDSTFTAPAYEYLHPDGCSVTGGRVYRGSKYPGMYGEYFFADICGGWIRSLDSNFVITDHGGFASSNFFVAFGENSKGDLFVAGLNDGIISEIVETTNNLESVDIPEFKIWPNPTSAWVKISGNSQGPLKVELLDQIGRILKSGNLNENNDLLLDLRDQEPGIYFIRGISNSKRSLTQKLIVH